MEIEIKQDKVRLARGGQQQVVLIGGSGTKWGNTYHQEYRIYYNQISNTILTKNNPFYVVRDYGKSKNKTL